MSTEQRVQLKTRRGTSKIEIAGRKTVHVPDFIASFRSEADAQFRVVLQRSRQGSPHAASLRIPAKQRKNIYGGALPVIVLRVYRPVREPSQNRKRGFDFRISQSVPFGARKHQIKLFIISGNKPERVTRENFERFNLNFRFLKVIELQNTGKRNSKSSIEQCRTHFRFAGNLYRLHQRTPDFVPMKQCGLDIPLQKIDRTKKLQRIFVSRIEAQSTAEILSCFVIAMFFKCDSGKFNGKPLFVWRSSAAIFECFFGFRPLLLLCQFHSSLKIDIRGGLRWKMCSG